MFTVRIGKSFHSMSWSAESSLDVRYNIENLGFYKEEKYISSFGEPSKSFLNRIAEVTIMIKSESHGGNKPSELEVSLSISRARELAEQLLKNAREAEDYINEIGQDG